MRQDQNGQRRRKALSPSISLASFNPLFTTDKNASSFSSSVFPIIRSAVLIAISNMTLSWLFQIFQGVFLRLAVTSFAVFTDSLISDNDFIPSFFISDLESLLHKLVAAVLSFPVPKQLAYAAISS